MTKSEFAVRLLFWLLPWPISRALPKALRIYYFGPTGEPTFPWEPGPPPSDYFPPTPIPPPPPDWPETPFPPPQWLPNPDFPQPPDWDPGVPPPPPFIINPGDPYIPGPGHPDGAPQPGQCICTLNCDNTYWTPYLGTWNSTQNIWEPEPNIDGMPTVGMQHLGTWVDGYRPVFVRVTYQGATPNFILSLTDTVGNQLCWLAQYVSGSLLLLSWIGEDIDYIYMRREGVETYIITNIEFL